MCYCIRASTNTSIIRVESGEQCDSELRTYVLMWDLGTGAPTNKCETGSGYLRGGGIVSYMIPYAYHTIHLCCQFPGQPIEHTSLPFQLGGRSEGPALLLLLLFRDLT